VQLRRSGPGAHRSQENTDRKVLKTSTHTRMHRPAVLPTAAQEHMMLVVKKAGPVGPGPAQHSSAQHAGP
jgi:hypothetical protein